MKNPTFMMCVLTAIAVTCVAQSPTWKRERGGKTDETKISWEGKAPPELQMASWGNTEPLTWKSLKGKVVLLDRAHW